MNRSEILKIYRESIYSNNDVREGFALAESMAESATGMILIPQAADGTMVRILRESGIEQMIYVTESRKEYRAMLHKMHGVKIIDDRDIEKIDLVRLCGNYKKHPECLGCKKEPATCGFFLGLPDEQFDAVMSMDSDLGKNVLRKYSGNVMIVGSNTSKEAEEQI